MADYDLIVLGGGAAGLAAAISAALAGRRAGRTLRILVLEKEAKLARKILASGNGRCNLTNQALDPYHYHSAEGLAAVSLAACLEVRALQSFFAECGLALKFDEMGRAYPLSEEARSVQQLLQQRAVSLGINFLCATEVAELRAQGAGYLVRASDGRTWTGKSLIFAVGSPAAPQLGGSHSAARFARHWQLKHIPERPALTSLHLRDTTLAKAASGARVKATARLPDGTCLSGEYLFTDVGLSGIAALELSNYLAAGSGDFGKIKDEECFILQHPCLLSIDFFPTWEAARVSALLQAKLESLNTRDPVLLLSSLLHSRLSKALWRRELNSRKAVQSLVYRLKNYPLEVTALRSFTYAQVAYGGIAFSNLQEDLSLKQSKGIFLAGECLDVIGNCGGYNLSFAFGSGILAGKNAVRRLQSLDG